MHTIVRSATLADASRIAAIYAPIVRDTAISFEEEPPPVEEMGRRIEAILPTHPYLVAERAGRVVGYAYGSQHRARAAYRWSAEVTVYVDADERKSGVGRVLYEHLLPALSARGFHAAFAGTALPNDASIALHCSMGFEPIGIFREVGFKFGTWCDVAWWQRLLSE